MHSCTRYGFSKDARGALTSYNMSCLFLSEILTGESALNLVEGHPILSPLACIPITLHLMFSIFF